MSLERTIRLPKLGLTMTEGTLVEWLVQPGQSVRAGDLLYICETEKIANEIAADEDGTLGELIVAAGDTVPVGTVLATWAGGEAAATASAPVGLATAPAPAARADARVDRPATVTGSNRLLATPHARKLARARGVDLALLHGSGPKGRIKAADVLVATTSSASTAARPAGQPAAQAAPAAVPMSAAQRTVAARMAQSKREIPHFYLEAGADIGELLELHRRLKQRPECAGLTITHWIVQALGMTLEEDPTYRRVWHEDGLQELPDSDVALAAATDKGLYVGVARRVGRRPLLANSRALDALTQRARAGRLVAEDSGGGATCVSNLGGTRVRRVFPIILPGQSTILGVGRTEALFRPDAEGRPVSRQELGLVLACDHRVLNGIDGARLLDTVIARLEDPLSLLLQATQE